MLLEIHFPNHYGILICEGNCSGIDVGLQSRAENVSGLVEENQERTSSISELLVPRLFTELYRSCRIKMLAIRSSVKRKHWKKFEHEHANHPTQINCEMI